MTIEFKEWTGDRKVIVDLVVAMNRLLDPYSAPRTPNSGHCRLNGETGAADYCLEHEAEFHPTKEVCPVQQARNAMSDAESCLSDMRPSALPTEGPAKP